MKKTTLSKKKKSFALKKILVKTSDAQTRYKRRGELSASVRTAKDISIYTEQSKLIMKFAELQYSLLNDETIDKKLKLITDRVVDIYGADFAGILLNAPDNKCKDKLVNLFEKNEEFSCCSKNKCQGLLLSSSRSQLLEEKILNALKKNFDIVCKIASGQYPSFLTNSLSGNFDVFTGNLAKQLGLKSFVCTGLRHPSKGSMGAFFLFSKKTLSEFQDHLFKTIANATVTVIYASEIQSVLKESEIKYKILVETIPQRIFVKDKNSVYISCNNNYAQDLGLNLEEISGKTDYDFFPKEIAEKYITDDKSIMKSGSTKGYEEQYIYKGKNIWVYTVKTPVKDEKGNINGILGVFSDVTELKTKQKEIAKIEKQLYQAQKMEAIGSLVSGLSHDLNNILSSISGLAELFLKEHKTKDTKRECVENILLSSKKAKDLVNNVLEFSKPKEMIFEPIDILPVINSTLKLLQPSIKHAAKVTVTVIPKYRLPIMGDATQLEQMFLNLIINARDAMEGKWGQLDIIVDEVFLMKEKLPNKEIKPGKYLKVTVRDTGKGMTRELKERIFEPFFTTKGQKGTGLGLDIVKRVIKQHNGTVTLESTIGKGATFHIYLPIISKV